MITLFPAQRRRFPLLAITAILVLTGCSFEDSLEPEPTATSTPITFGPTDVAVETLLNEASAAWDSVGSWRVETRTEAPSDGSSATTSVSVETVILPDDRHVVTMNGDTVVSEEIFTEDRLYMRGTLISTSIYPNVEPESWISFTAEQVPADTPLDQRVTYLTTPPSFPFASMSEETRMLPAKPAGEIKVDDRVCLVYRFTSPTAGSEGIDYRIAFDEEDRPCQLVREAGGVVETSTWHYPDPTEPITPPEDAVEVDQFPGGP